MDASGDYFADDEYVRTNGETGVTRDRAGTRLLALSEDFLVALRQAIDTEVGPGETRALDAAGHEWGRRFAERLTSELESHRGESLAASSMARFETDLQSAFRQLGWGVLSLDFNGYDKGVLIAEVRHAPAGGPADMLLAGALAGVLSQVAGRELAAAATSPVGDLRRFVIALPERLEQVRDALHRRRPHDEVVKLLEGVRV
jgi:predicted hydrocarbon binding protein